MSPLGLGHRHYKPAMKPVYASAKLSGYGDQSTPQSNACRDRVVQKVNESRTDGRIHPLGGEQRADRRRPENILHWLCNCH